MGRYAHAASHITGPVFVMSGGVRDDMSMGMHEYTLSDMWLCDTTNKWIKVFHNVQFTVMLCACVVSHSK